MNQNLLIISEDLEQKYHRGIAYYSKSLLKASHSLGYNNYLLTGAPTGNSADIKELLVIKNLLDPVIIDYGRKKKIAYYLKKYFSQSKHDYQDILLERYRNVVQNESRLDYIKHLKGFVNKPSQYTTLNFHPLHFNSTVEINVSKNRKYKAVISTSPLPIKMKDTPLIQTLHDIIPVSTHFHPSTPSVLETIYKRYQKMLVHSDFILSVSEYSRQELLAFYPGYENKIKTTHIAVPIAEEEYQLAQHAHISTAILVSNGLVHKEFIFYVGAIEERKNIERIILAFNAVKSKIKIPLVLAGEIPVACIQLKKLIAQNKDIIYLGTIDSITKLILLKSARAFIFPSLYEGFGIPPLEAMRMGCPVLTSNVTSLPEVCGDAALYVNPYSMDDIIDKLLLITTDEGVQNDLSAKGKEHVKQFSNENYSERLKTVLDLVS